jgi:tRNA(fMet)-specific endonuclease VapC
MYLLDTVHMSLLDRGGAEGARLRDRLRSAPPDDVATTIVSYEEQMRGWISRLARAADATGQVADYAQLRRHLRNYCGIPVVEFDAAAAATLARLRTAGIRIGTMDLKIAAIALTAGATLLTRNLTDFGRVPDLDAEDWSL